MALLCFTNLPVLAQTVTFHPSQVQLTGSQDYIISGQSRTIYIGSDTNLTGVKVYASDLIEESGGQMEIEQRSIPKETIKLGPVVFDLRRGDLTQLKFNLSYPDAEPGTYKGSLFLIGNNLPMKTIPITVQIHANTNIALALIAVGVFANFILKVLKKKLDLKDVGLLALNRARDMRRILLSKAYGLSKAAKPKVEDSNQRLIEATQELKHGNFRESEKLAKQSYDHYKIVSMDLNNYEVIKMPDVPKESSSQPEKTQEDYLHYETTASHEVSFRNLFFAPPKRGDFIAFGVLSLVLGITILFAWQTNIASIRPNFGASPIDYITMFTLGFGSQSILSEAFEFALKRF